MPPKGKKVGAVYVEVGADLTPLQRELATARSAMESAARKGVVLRAKELVGADAIKVPVEAHWNAGALGALQASLSKRKFIATITKLELAPSAITSLQAAINKAVSGIVVPVKFSGSVSGAATATGPAANITATAEATVGTTRARGAGGRFVKQAQQEANDIKQATKAVDEANRQAAKAAGGARRATGTQPDPERAKAIAEAKAERARLIEEANALVNLIDQRHAAASQRAKNQPTYPAGFDPFKLYPTTPDQILPDWVRLARLGPGGLLRKPGSLGGRFISKDVRAAIDVRRAQLLEAGLRRAAYAEEDELAREEAGGKYFGLDARRMRGKHYGGTKAARWKYGMVVDDDADRFIIDTQARPTHGGEPTAPTTIVAGHELARQSLNRQRVASGERIVLDREPDADYSYADKVRQEYEALVAAGKTDEARRLIGREYGKLTASGFRVGRARNRIKRKFNEGGRLSPNEELTHYLDNLMSGWTSNFGQPVEGTLNKRSGQPQLVGMLPRAIIVELERAQRATMGSHSSRKAWQATANRAYEASAEGMGQLSLFPELGFRLPELDLHGRRPTGYGSITDLLGRPVEIPSVRNVPPSYRLLEEMVSTYSGGKRSPRGKYSTNATIKRVLAEFGIPMVEGTPRGDIITEATDRIERFKELYGRAGKYRRALNEARNAQGRMGELAEGYDEVKPEAQEKFDTLIKTIAEARQLRSELPKGSDTGEYDDAIKAARAQLAKGVTRKGGTLWRRLDEAGLTEEQIATIKRYEGFNLSAAGIREGRASLRRAGAMSFPSGAERLAHHGAEGTYDAAMASNLRATPGAPGQYVSPPVPGQMTLGLAEPWRKDEKRVKVDARIMNRAGSTPLAEEEVVKAAVKQAAEPVRPVEEAMPGHGGFQIPNPLNVHVVNFQELSSILSRPGLRGTGTGEELRQLSGTPEELAKALGLKDVNELQAVLRGDQQLPGKKAKNLKGSLRYDRLLASRDVAEAFPAAPGVGGRLIIDKNEQSLAKQRQREEAKDTREQRATERAEARARRLNFQPREKVSRAQEQVLSAIENRGLFGPQFASNGLTLEENARLDRDRESTIEGKALSRTAARELPIRSGPLATISFLAARFGGQREFQERQARLNDTIGRRDALTRMLNERESDAAITEAKRNQLLANQAEYMRVSGKESKNLTEQIAGYDSQLRVNATAQSTLKGKIDETNNSIVDQSAKLVTGKDILRNFATIAIGGAFAGVAFGAANKAVQLGFQALEKVVAPAIDQQMNYRATADATTKALAAQNKALYGNIQATMATAQVQAGGTAASAAYANQNLQPGVIAQTAAQNFVGLSDIIRSSYSYGGAPVGLFGGYGGLLGGPLGGQAGFTERIAGDFAKYASDMQTQPHRRGQFAVDTDQATKAIGAYQAELDTLNQEFNKGAKVAGLAADSIKLVGNATKEQADAMAAAGAAAGDRDNARQMAMSRIALVNANGKTISAQDYQKFFQTSALGTTKPDMEQMLNIGAQQLKAQMRGNDLMTAFTKGAVIPAQYAEQRIANPPVAPNVGTQFLRLPNAPSGGLFGLSNTSISQDIGAAQKLFEQANKLADRGAVLNIVPPDLKGDASTLLTELDGIGKQIQTINAAGVNRQLAYEASQYANQERIATRELADAKALAGQSYDAHLGIVGALERENVMLDRQSTVLGFQAQTLQQELSQRQINFQLAVAGFQAPGLTAEERGARIEQAKIEAAYAQQQLDIQKQQLALQRQVFTVAIKLFDEQNIRRVIDATKSLELLQQGRAIQIKAVIDQKSLAVLADKESLVQQQLDADIQKGVQNQQLLIQTAVQAAGTIGEAVDTFYTTLTERTNQYLQLVGAWFMNPFGASPFATGGTTGYKGSTANHAAGALFTTSGATTMTVGEAGTETVAVLRNPRSVGLTPYSSGGTVQVNIIGTQVRSDDDIYRIARAVSDVLNKRAASIGLRTFASGL